MTALTFARVAAGASDHLKVERLVLRFISYLAKNISFRPFLNNTEYD